MTDYLDATSLRLPRLERANLSAFRTFVRFALVWFCLFPLPLGVWEGLRSVIVVLPGLFSYLLLCVSLVCVLFCFHMFCFLTVLLALSTSMAAHSVFWLFAFFFFFARLFFHILCVFNMLMSGAGSGDKAQRLSKVFRAKLCWAWNLSC